MCTARVLHALGNCVTPEGGCALCGQNTSLVHSMEPALGTRPGPCRVGGRGPQAVKRLKSVLVGADQNLPEKPAGLGHTGFSVSAHGSPTAVRHRPSGSVGSACGSLRRGRCRLAGFRGLGRLSAQDWWGRCRLSWSALHEGVCLRRSRRGEQPCRGTDRTVAARTVIPDRARSPRTLRCPHSGFSRARRRISPRVSEIGGRPGLLWG
jgi:hypothetical protein